MALSETRAALSRLFTKSSLVKNRINDASFVFSRILTPLVNISLITIESIIVFKLN